MLANIHVKNMALIKEADISLGKGLNILSGETGAGKSILLGSIAVALGLQNFKGFAREDADYALSELVFVIENEEQRQALLELEIPVEDGEVIISRRLSKGRTTSKINGETVPVSMVRKAGTLLIDIHGQHENQSLLHIRKHLELLDDFAGEKLTLAKENYKTCYQEYGELKKELQQAQLDNATRAKEMDFLSFEIGEIEEAARMDGANPLQVVTRIVLPLAKPSIVVTALMVLIYVWNEYIYATTFMTGEENYTLAAGLYALQATEMSGSWPVFAAASITVSIPVLIIFFLCQKHMTSGLTAGGVKG